MFSSTSITRAPGKSIEIMESPLSVINRKLASLRSAKITGSLYGLSVLAVLVRLAIFVIHEPFIEGDTNLLVNKEINAIRTCLSEGHLSGCYGSGDFPLLQNVPSLVLSYLGFSSTAILHTLAYLSFLSFLGSILLFFSTLKRKSSLPVAVTGAIIMITGPLLWYSHSTYGEMAAAFLILLFTAACLLGAPAWTLTVLFILAGSTKEIAFPFLFTIGLLCLLAKGSTKPQELYKRIAPLVGGAVAIVLAASAFNYFRFGTLSNSVYLTNLFIVPTFKLQVSFFLGIWFSPNGGLAVFWPSFTLLYFAILGMVFLQFLRNSFGEQSIGLRRRGFSFYLPIFTISAVLFLLTAGFSRWYTPLGGAAWGPRYMLPWIPAVLLLLLYFYCEEVEAVLRLVLSKPFGFVLACVTLVVLSTPQFSILFGDFVLSKIFAYPDCPHAPIIQEGVEYYYECLQTQIWPLRFVISESYRVALNPPALWFSILYGVTLVGGLLWTRRKLADDRVSLKSNSTIASYLGLRSILQNAVRTPARHCVLVVLFYCLLFTVFFFPAFYTGSLLAVGGDGIYIYLPNFYSHKVLWDPLLFSGFPMMADPNVMTWYPPAFLLSLLPGTWNLFMMMAYVAASSFMYGYVYTLSESRFAALVSGVVFGMSGIMMAHLGHAIIVHSIAWVPLIIWSLEQLRRRLSAAWLVIGSIGITFCFLGGQPQIFFYGLIMSVGYAIVFGWNAPVGLWRYYLASLLMVILGVSLAAVQIIPTIEIFRAGMRASYSFQDFVSHSLPPRQILTMIFPTVYGGVPESGLLPYFGAVNQTELTGYAGLLPLMLAAIGIITYRRKSLSVFWLCTAVIACLLAMGNATPLAHLIYHVPVLKSFRAPARHFLELTFAASVLSGFGVAAILRREVSASLMRRVILIAGFAMVGCLILLFMNSSNMAGLARQRDITGFSVLPWANRAVGIPLMIFLLAIAGLTYLHRVPTAPLRRALLLALLAIDLGSFGWLYDWRYASPDRKALTAPEIANRYKNQLDATNQRLMPYRGPRGAANEMAPNLTRLWGVPSASGYNALVLSRTSRLLPMIDNVGTPLPWSEPENQSLDLMAVRYLFLPRSDPMTDDRGILWLGDEMEFWLGHDCTQQPRSSARLTLPAPVKSNALAVVSRLGCASQIPDGTEVVRLRISDTDGRVQTRSLVAGRDSSEWAYDCSGVRPLMRHQQANVFSSYPATMHNEPCAGHFYVTKVALDEVRNINRIEFEWVGGPGAIILDKLSLIDETTHTSNPLDPALMDNAHWRFVEQTDEARIYENLRALPRVWLATEAVEASSEAALDAIRSGKLSDGRSFDPNRTALVEAPLALNSPNTDSKASATVTALSATHMEVHTSSAAASFLITSDAYYPGWQASVDDRETPLYRADYAIRGVMLSPGRHAVRFDYSPRSFYLGAGISMLSLLVLGAIACTARLFRRQE